MTQALFREFLPLKLSFLIFSMLLNCMGIIILYYSGSEISYRGLGQLEFFKDIPIALMSILAVGLINKMGTKRSLQASLFLVMLCCSLLPIVDDFWFLRIWFVIIGVSFAIAKISVFGLIRANSENEKRLSQVMNSVEASFMIGIFCVNILFGWLLESYFKENWKWGFFLIAILSLVTIVLLQRRNYKEIPQQDSITNFSNVKQVINSKTVVFFAILFCIVFVEQGFNSWMPTFYKEHFGVNSFLALQSTAFLALFSFIGRIATSKLIQRFHWWKYILFCLISAGSIMLFGQYLISNTNPIPFFLMMLLPCIGLFIAPLYPLYNSKFLVQVPVGKVNLLVSFIVIISSLGSSIGSMFMAFIFDFSLSRYYLSFSFIPLVFIFLLTAGFLKTIIKKD